METVIKTQEKQAQYELDQRIFPYDELGIPLSIYIPRSYRAADGQLDKINHPVDRHHRFAPKKVLLHKQGELGKALRYSCLQVVPKELHVAFNGYYERPQLPDTSEKKFGALLISVARYLPAEAIDVSSGSPERRELSLSERHRIWANNELRPEQAGKIQQEILDYVTRQNIHDIDEELVHEFLSTPYDGARIEAGRQLFRIAAEVAVEPVNQQYLDAWSSALLPRQDVRLQPGNVGDLIAGRAVPRSPGKFIVRHVAGNKYMMKKTLDKLERNLLAHAA